MVQNETDLDLLGRKPARWNASTTLPFKTGDSSVGEDMQKLADSHRNFIAKKGLHEGAPIAMKP